MKEHPVFWVACRNPDALLNPLALDVPGLGEALAVFCFEEEARPYVGYGNDGLHLRPLGPDELVVLLLGSWSRFESITLDPMPHSDAGVMLRLASMHRDDFLNYLLRKRDQGHRASDDSQQAQSKGRDLGYTRPDPARPSIDRIWRGSRAGGPD